MAAELRIVETTTFKKALEAIASNAHDARVMRAAIDEAIVSSPEAGDVIPGTGGARKLRVAVPGRGKRGGARVIYALVWGRTAAYLLLAYDKADVVNMTPDEKKAVKHFIAIIEREGPSR
jgi:hypothetical protein